MAFKPNYQQQRGDRDRAKAQKKLERLQRLEEQAAKRKEPQFGHSPENESTDDAPPYGKEGNSSD
jgi:hypothetical protein